MRNIKKNLIRMKVNTRISILDLDLERQVDEYVDIIIINRLEDIILSDNIHIILDSFIGNAYKQYD